MEIESYISPQGWVLAKVVVWDGLWSQVDIETHTHGAEAAALTHLSLEEA